MTRNLYFGADLAPVISTPDAAGFVAAATQAYRAAQASDFAGRAQAIAADIAVAEPLFVGLQEVAIWRTGPLGSPAPATQVEADFAQLILDNLTGTYNIVAAKAGFDAEVPTTAGVDVQLTIQDVLLVRVGLKTADLKLNNVQAGVYATQVVLSSPVGPLRFPHQWFAVDAKIHGKKAPIITTHLESIALPVRLAQAQELLDGPANTPLPTLLLGDLNAESAAADDAASRLIAHGFSDAWSWLHPANTGFTCCQAADLRNPVSQLTRRIDLILVRNGPEVIASQRVGADPLHLSPSGVQWASDHAGVTATVHLP
jgi:hypothetical protein